MTGIAARLPADQQPAVWASAALRRTVTGLLAVPGASPGQVVELLCRGSFAGTDDAVAVLVGHRAQVAEATLTAQAHRRAAAAAEAAEHETRRREQEQAAAQEQAAVAAAALPSSVLRAVLAADLATTPQLVRRPVPRAVAAVTACTRAALNASPRLPADRAVLASLHTADTLTPQPDDDATAAGLVDAVRARLAATAQGAGR